MCHLYISAEGNFTDYKLGTEMNLSNQIRGTLVWSICTESHKLFGACCKDTSTKLPFLSDWKESIVAEVTRKKIQLKLVQKL